MLRRSQPRAPDWARGFTGLAVWAVPIGELAVASVLGQTHHITGVQEGALLVLGTLVFGGMCLVNALRCGRTHCWIDGTLLPALAVVGVLNLTETLSFAWNSFPPSLWGIVILSFVVECVVGPYPWRRSR